MYCMCYFVLILTLVGKKCNSVSVPPENVNNSSMSESTTLSVQSVTPSLTTNSTPKLTTITAPTEAPSSTKLTTMAVPMKAPSSTSKTPPEFWDPLMGGTPNWLPVIPSSPSVANTSCEEMDHPPLPSNFDPNTDMGIGFECMANFYNYFPCATYEEFLCICMDSCTEEEIKQLDEDFKVNHTAKPYKNGISDNFRITILYIVMLIGVFGNVLVIITIVAFMGKQTVTNMYIFNLAVADLLVIFVCIPFKIVDAASRDKWTAGDGMCRIVSWLYFYSFMCSVFTLTAMSIERFLVICYPVSSHVISSTRRTTVIIAVVWFSAAFLASPALYIFQARFYGTFTICHVNEWNNGYRQRLGFYLYIFIVIFIIPCLVMGFAYTRTCISLWESIKKQRELKNSQAQQSSVKEFKGNKQRLHKSTSNGRFQVIKVLILVLIAFCCCWLPYLLTQVIVLAGRQPGVYTVYEDYERELSKWFNVLSLANSCLNPILYGLLSRRYREGFIRCFKCDTKSLNKKRSSILTASSSIGGASLHKQNSSKNNRQCSVKSINLEPVPEAQESEYEQKTIPPLGQPGKNISDDLGTDKIKTSGITNLGFDLEKEFSKLFGESFNSEQNGGDCNNKDTSDKSNAQIGSAAVKKTDSSKGINNAGLEMTADNHSQCSDNSASSQTSDYSSDKNSAIVDDDDDDSSNTEENHKEINRSYPKLYEHKTISPSNESEA